MADPLVGQTVGPFEILGRLGAGAMGVVYKARYTNGALVALKILPGNPASLEPENLARFEREAKILQQLKHPHIVRLYGTGRHRGAPYYAMEYVPGESLSEILYRKGKLNWHEVADLARQLCDALQHAHDLGVIHRDLKPSNLMIAKDGSLKLADFGIAKDLDQTTQLTGAHCAVGTAAYMAPEQCRAQNISPRTDLYSLGVVMFELLTGSRPFTGESSMEIFQKHLSEKPQKPSRLVHDIPGSFDTLVLHLMEKESHDRPPDARTVAESLTRIEERQDTLARAGVTRTRKKGRKGSKGRQAEPFWRSLWFVGPAALASFACIGLFGWWVFLSPPGASSLLAQADRLDRDGGDDGWRILAESSGPAARYLELYADGPAAQRMRALLDRAQAREGERLLRRHIGQKGQRFKVEPPDATSAKAFAAADQEEAGALEDARVGWEALLAEGLPWSAVARRHLRDIADAITYPVRLEKKWHEAVEGGSLQSPTGETTPVARAGFLAWRSHLADQLGDAWLGHSLASEAAALLREDLDSLLLNPGPDTRAIYLHCRKRGKGAAPANVVESRRDALQARLAAAAADPSPRGTVILSAISQVYEPTTDLAAQGREARNIANARAGAQEANP